MIFDLAVVPPTPGPERTWATKRLLSRSAALAQGSVGGGTGATVGKVLGLERAMKGGLGSASVALEDGLLVGSLAVVNAFGHVRDSRTGKILAGPRLDDGRLGDTVELLPTARMRWENTTLGVVATNARLTRPQATKVAQMAHDGLARAIEPIHTSVDGDVVFAASAGDLDSAPDVVGAGARVLEEAVLRAVLRNRRPWHPCRPEPAPGHARWWRKPERPWSCYLSYNSLEGETREEKA